MSRQADNNMKINIAKCFLRHMEVNYLGFRLTPQGIKPGKDKLKAVEKAKSRQQKKK
jgi:hypothetical protein